jgi:hypothetical protein
VAGNGTEGYTGDGGPATQAQLNMPGGLALAADGSIYIADTHNNAIRRINRAGIITTVAGTGSACYSGDKGTATEASLHMPYHVALGPDGDLYFADFGNHRVRKIRLRPCEPEAAKAKGDALRATAGRSIEIWREVIELYLIAKAWDQALAAARQVLAITPEADQQARMSAEVLIARVYVAKRDDPEARRRLMRVLANTGDPVVIREAADVLVGLYLARGEREQAIATLTDLRARTAAGGLRQWADQRLKELADE